MSGKSPLVEEEGGFTLERPLTEPLPAGIEAASGGDVFTVGGAKFQVEDMGEGTVAGGEGQLPRGFEPGEAFRYLDLSEIGGRGRLGVEFFEGETLAFLGRTVSRKEGGVSSASTHCFRDRRGRVRCPAWGAVQPSMCPFLTRRRR